MQLITVHWAKMTKKCLWPEHCRCSCDERRWYLDLFAGKNDHEAVKRAGAGGHKEINRTNLSAAQIEELMKTDIVKEQLKLLHFRNVSKAFGFDAELAVSTEGEIITFIWTNQGESATLRANLKTFEYEITDSEGIYA